jgi:hypothetical protein
MTGRTPLETFPLVAGLVGSVYALLPRPQEPPGAAPQVADSTR